MVEGKGEDVDLRRERKRFRDMNKDLKIGKADERVIFVIFVMGSSLTVA